MTVYNKTNWTDRIVAKPMTFTLINNGDGTTTLSPAEGAVTQAGTAINATVMNNLEKQYDFALDEVSKNYLPLVGGTIQGNLAITGNLTGVTINASTALQEAGVTLSSKYLGLVGGTLTGTLNGTTINALTALQEAGVNLSTKYSLATHNHDTTYLKLAGGNLTGLLTGTTINATTALQEAGVPLTSKYLKLDGTNIMTGSFTVGSGQFLKVMDSGGNTVNFLSTQAGDSTGIGIALSSGGKMVIGAGESSTTVMNDVSTGTGQQEMMYVTSDNDIMLWSNVQAGIANKNEFKFDKNAVATINGVTVASDQIGTSIWSGAVLLTADITGLKDITTCPNGWQLEFRNTSGTAYISYAYIHKSCSKGSALLVECGNTQNANYNKKTTGVATNLTTLTSSASNGTGDPASRNLSNIRIW